MRSALAASAFLLAVSFLAACGGDEGSTTAGGAEPAAFSGTPWKLVSGVEGIESAPPSATFENGVVGGSTGCNPSAPRSRSTATRWRSG
jgi:hypothetical protein